MIFHRPIGRGSCSLPVVTGNWAILGHRQEPLPGPDERMTMIMERPAAKVIPPGRRAAPRSGAALMFSMAYFGNGGA